MLTNITNLLFKNHYINLYKESIITQLFSKHFLQDFQTIVPKDEYESFVNEFAKQIIDNESIGTIYYFFTIALEKNPPITLEALIRSKNIEQIIDFGSAFSSQEDKGYSVRELVFSLIKENSDQNGNFIIDNQPDGKRALFLGYFFSYSNWDKNLDYINSISYHDRILLSQSRYYGYDLATVQDLKMELINTNPDNNIEHITQRIRNSKTAIIQIINELTEADYIDSTKLIAWIRQYLNIRNRKYYDNEKKICDENILISSIKRAEDGLHMKLNQYGIDTENFHIASSYESLSYCDSLINQIFNWKVETEDGISLSISKEEFDQLPCPIVSFIEEILCDTFKYESLYENYEHKEKYEIQCHSKIVLQPKSILSFILLNVFNNVEDIIMNENANNRETMHTKLLIINDSNALDMTTCILKMDVKHGMDAFWRVGDRGDIETNYTDIEINFDKIPSHHILEIITNKVPELTSDSSTKYSYHFSESEVASGYGRSYDWDDSDSYKAGIVSPILKSVYIAFEKGLPMFSE